MNITFDPNKDRINLEKHGISLAAAEELDWDDKVEWEDERYDYQEERRCVLGMIGERIYYLVYVKRDGNRRIISLRKANKREVQRYVEQTK